MVGDSAEGSIGIPVVCLVEACAHIKFAGGDGPRVDTFAPFEGGVEARPTLELMFGGDGRYRHGRSCD